MELSDEKLTSYLKESHTIAVIGLSEKEEKTSHRVSAFMQDKGYKIIPINPKMAGQTILGQRVYASLQEVEEPIDIVNIFRRSEFLPGIAEEFIQTKAKIFWAQLGIENEQAAEILTQANRLDFVMDRCIKIEYQRLIEQP
ncbi:CoA-binding protein [Enterococcus columbae]|uniref:CoA-binding protein n=1 Tax=Enterococcus columbae DSM 7374 = ATCC 51263 TaxID=1121865 RepID=S1NWA1_9ENTE|nr:CoA-binding protein [Enterococcus columbae]EOT44258.1 CoA-binding protein [Enterococcus columbae DSM 7374 = ATCC 51263]EOW84416.1 CoA-binding protein [Enterococcus columbae DSM 7374 = ATCC 51263]OJG26024.1 CoA-binding protein [Enterococcus columbae DSM 7374 = ATCC 51263]